LHWVTVFTVEGHPAFNPAAAIFALLFSVIGISFAALPVAPKFGLGGWGRRAFGLFIAAFSLAITMLMVGGGYLQHASLMRKLQAGNAQVVEGVVTNFRPMPESGHGYESFDVAGKHFAYDDYIDSGGFNSSSTFGGPIRAGQRVRIAYTEGVILRLQIES
jgi:hypothetical protein